MPPSYPSLAFYFNVKSSFQNKITEIKKSKKSFGDKDWNFPKKKERKRGNRKRKQKRKIAKRKIAKKKEPQSPSH